MNRIDEAREFPVEHARYIRALDAATATRRAIHDALATRCSPGLNGIAANGDAQIAAADAEVEAASEALNAARDNHPTIGPAWRRIRAILSR